MKQNLTNESVETRTDSKATVISNLEQDFQYFISNQDNLVAEYEGKFIVIVDDKVVGSYESKEEAYVSAKNKFGLGRFLIQRCEPGTEIYTANYTSRVVL